MKLKDLVPVCKDYDRIKIIEEFSYNACLKDGEEVDCDSCGRVYGGDCPDNVEHEKRIGRAEQFKGKANDVPIKLADKRVKQISATLGKGKRVWLEVTVE